MKRVAALAAAGCAVALLPATAGVADDGASAVFGVTLPAGYRDWRLISVAHEAVKFADQKYKHMEDLEDLNRHKLESAIDYILRNVADTDIDISVDKEIARDKIEVVIHDLHQHEDQES